MITGDFCEANDITHALFLTDVVVEKRSEAGVNQCEYLDMSGELCIVMLCTHISLYYELE